MKPRIMPSTSSLAGLPEYRAAKRALVRRICTPARFRMIVSSSLEKHGEPDVAAVGVTGGLYGRVVPGTVARQVPVVALVAVELTDGSSPGRHAGPPGAFAGGVQ